MYHLLIMNYGYKLPYESLTALLLCIVKCNTGRLLMAVSVTCD